MLVLKAEDLSFDWLFLGCAYTSVQLVGKRAIA